MLHVSRGGGDVEASHPEHGVVDLEANPFASMSRSELVKALNVAVRTTLATPMRCPTRSDGEEMLDAWLTPTVALPYVHCSRCDSPHVDDLIGMLRQVLTRYDAAYFYDKGDVLLLRVHPVGDVQWQKEHRSDLNDQSQETLELLKRKALIATHKRQKANLYAPER